MLPGFGPRGAPPLYLREHSPRKTPPHAAGAMRVRAPYASDAGIALASDPFRGLYCDIKGMGKESGLSYGLHELITSVAECGRPRTPDGKPSGGQQAPSPGTVGAAPTDTEKKHGEED